MRGWCDFCSIEKAKEKAHGGVLMIMDEQYGLSILVKKGDVEEFVAWIEEVPIKCECDLVL
jgi:hypothetical protein